MIPQKAKDHIGPQALAESIPEQDLQDMVNGYWREVNKSMEELRHIRIKVDGLGEFRVVYNRVLDCIDKEKHTRTKGKVAKRHKTARIMQLTRLKDAWTEEYEYQKQARKVKKHYKETGTKLDKHEIGVFTGKLTEGMGAQGSDTGGVLQQVHIVKQRYRRVSDRKKKDL